MASMVNIFNSLHVTLSSDIYHLGEEIYTPLFPFVKNSSMLLKAAVCMVVYNTMNNLTITSGSLPKLGSQVKFAQREIAIEML